MKVTVSGASGFIGTRLAIRLKERGDEITVLSRPGSAASSSASAVPWDPMREPAPPHALSGRDAVIHLAGEPVAQRWTEAAKRRILDSRVLGTRHLVEGLQAIPPAARPQVLICSSAVGYYGAHGAEVVDERTPPGDSFLSDVSAQWEHEAGAARELGVRVVYVRTGIVLDASGGTLKTLLPAYRLGLGGPVAGGAQYMPWIHLEDIVGLYLKAADDPSWNGPYNGSAPTPVTNKSFAKALGRALHRPAAVPTPRFALTLLLGEMAEMVTTGQRAVPQRTLDGGYAYAHPDLDAALADALRDPSPDRPHGSQQPVVPLHKETS